jgi:hypothetical protein
MSKSVVRRGSPGRVSTVYERRQQLAYCFPSELQSSVSSTSFAVSVLSMQQEGSAWHKFSKVSALEHSKCKTHYIKGF